MFFDEGAIEAGKPYMNPPVPEHVCAYCEAEIWDEFYVTEEGEEVCEGCYEEYQDDMRRRARREV